MWDPSLSGSFCFSNIQQFSCYFKELPSLEHKNHKNGKKNNHIKNGNSGHDM